MKPLAAIRTHRWGAAEKRLFARLYPVFGDRLVVAFHNRPADLDLPVSAVDINDAWLERNGLLRTDDWGWRCGDYFLYALREARPEHDQCWLIEPDIHFTSVPGGFFAGFDGAEEYVLGSRVEAPRDQGRFTVALGDMRLVRATFALTRVSGRGIDALLAARQDMAARNVNHRYWPNDEFFVDSVLAATSGMRVGSLETYAPGWFDGTSITPSPDHLLEAVEAILPPDRVIHPVHDRAGFCQAIQRRFVDASEFLVRHRSSLAWLEDNEINELSAMIGVRIGEEIRRNRDTYLARRGRTRRRQV